MGSALLWWFFLTVTGWAAFPLVSRALKRPNAGYALSRAIGLIIISLLSWLMGIVGGATFSQVSILALSTLLALISIWSWKRHFSSLRQRILESWKTFLIVEILFAVSFGAYSLFRMHLPAAAHTEQPMDLAMLSSLMRSTTLPPPDPWLSGHIINYYYGGYLQIALVGKSIGTSPGIAYNLGLAQTFALTVTSLFGLISLLLPRNQSQSWKNTLASFGSLAIVFSGNLASLLQILETKGVLPSTLLNWLGLPCIETTNAHWWWFQASRIAQDTNMFGRTPLLITEFPAFSFVLGDLHPHLMGLVPLISGIAASFALAERNHNSPSRLLKRPIFWISCATMATSAITNSWDTPTLILVFFVASLCRHRDASLGQALWFAIRSSLMLASISLLVAAPFFVALQTPTGGIDISYYAFSDIALYVLMFGTWLLPISAAISPCGTSRRRLAGAIIALLGALCLGVLLFGGMAGLMLSVIGLSTGGWLWVALCLILGGLLTRLLSTSDGLVFRKDELLVISALLISLFAEWFYLRDLFAARMNTVFKIYYQVWILLGVAGVLSISRLAHSNSWKRGIGAVASILVLVCCSYTGLAIDTRLGQESVTPAMDGLSWLQQDYPDEYAAIVWLSNHAGAEDVLAEAWGNEYAAGESRFSSSTGITSVLGWYGHEMQWRGSSSELARRRRDIDELYDASTAPERAREILTTYDVDWIIMSPVEKARYDLHETPPRMENIACLAYQQGDVCIFAVPD